MILPIYLAMTPRQLEKSPQFLEKKAYMSCHFSASGQGLSNVPSKLPKDTTLILDDSTPVNCHDLSKILADIKALDPARVLLDMQRPATEESSAIVKGIIENLPCPVGVSIIYAGNYDCPVFVPPIPVWTEPEKYLSTWQGREIWLELSVDAVLAKITEKGTDFFWAEQVPNDLPTFYSEQLYCHYCGREKEDHIDYFLWRTANDCRKLAEHSAKFGVTAAIGLFQQFYL